MMPSNRTSKSVGMMPSNRTLEVGAGHYNGGQTIVAFGQCSIGSPFYWLRRKVNYIIVLVSLLRLWS